MKTVLYKFLIIVIITMLFSRIYVSIFNPLLCYLERSSYFNKLTN